MPTRAELVDTLATSQTQVLAFFQGLSSHDLERPATASEVPGAAPWCAKDHFAHLVKSERNRQRLLRATLAGETRDALLRLQYPAGMPLPGTLGDWDALTLEEQERLALAVDNLNQAYVDAHHGDALETISADFLAARQDTLDLLRQFTDEQLAAPLPTVVGEQTVGDVFAWGVGHPRDHMSWIEEGLRQGI
jgi:DinB superfamily